MFSVDPTLGIKNTYVRDNQFSTDLINRLYDEKKKSATEYKSSNTAENYIKSGYNLSDIYIAEGVLWKSLVQEGYLEDLTDLYDSVIPGTENFVFEHYYDYDNRYELDHQLFGTEGYLQLNPKESATEHIFDGFAFFGEYLRIEDKTVMVELMDTKDSDYVQYYIVFSAQ